MSSLYKTVDNSLDIALDRGQYIRTIALSTIVMILVLGSGASITWSWAMSWPLLLVSSFGVIGCICIFQGSSNPAISVVGVTGMSLLLGMQIGPVLGTYAMAYKGIVAQALVITGGIVISMSAAGILKPSTFEGFGPYLMAGLWTLIWVQLSQIILNACGFVWAQNIPIVTWGGVLLFALFTAWDWASALKRPHTLDNAIDASGGLILNFVNLLLRILQILSWSKNDD